MRLVELQAAVHRLLRHDATTADTARALDVPSDRLDIYRAFVTGHITHVLGKVYPYVRAVVRSHGEAAWNALALAFFREVPAATRELNASVEPFAAWLDTQVATRPEVAPWLPTLAQLEWELFAAWAHEAEVSAEVSAERAGPIINPTLSILETAWAVVPWLVAHPEVAEVTAASAPARLDAPQVALIFRRHGGDKAFRVGFHVATGELMFALKVIGEAVPLAAAADLAGLTPEAAQRIIDEAVAIGLVIVPD